MNTIRDLIRTGAIVGAAFSLASNAYAVGWCPTSTDYKITCDQCFRELTCDVNNVSLIWIAGTGVTLDGKSFHINYASTGIYVTGSSATIKNVIIESPYNDGVFIASQYADGSSSYLENVTVNRAGQFGIRNGGNNSAAINRCSVLYTAQYGVVGNGLGYTDLQNSTVQNSGYDGAYYLRGNSPIIYNNQIVNGNQYGLHAQNISGASISTNVFTGNGYGGLRLETGIAKASLKSNWGWYNGSTDCQDASGGGVTYQSGNSWGSISGPGCAH